MSRAFALSFAEKEIQGQVYRFVNDELIYAQAENTLDQAEKDFANQLTMMWRQRQVAENAGSLQQTRAQVHRRWNRFRRGAERQISPEHYGDLHREKNPPQGAGHRLH